MTNYDNDERSKRHGKERAEPNAPSGNGANGKKRLELVPIARSASLTGLRLTKKAVVTPQVLFLVVAFVFGILMILVNPMFHVPDEPAHFGKAYDVSQGHLFPTMRHGREGYYLPISLQSVGETVTGKLGRKINEKAVSRAFKIPLKPEVVQFVKSNASAYPPLPYLPQAVGIALGRLFNTSPLALAYIGRVFNLFSWLVLVFLAISITPILKWALFLLGIMPMSIHMAASLSSDCMTNGVALLIIAFFLKLSCSKDKASVTRRDIVLIFVLGAMLAFMKPPYFLLVLLFLMIPPARFKNRKLYYVTFALLFMLVLAIGSFWTVKGAGASVGPVRYREMVSPGEQIGFILKHPLEFSITLLRSMNLNKQELLSQIVGRFGWLEVPLPDWFPYFYLFAFIAISALDKDSEILMRARQRITTLGALVITTITIWVALYLTWSPVGNHAISGVQGRYFIPVIPLVCLLLYNQAIMYKKGKWFYTSMVGLSMITVFLSIYKIWIFYY